MDNMIRLVAIDFETLGTTPWQSPITEAGFWAIDLADKKVVQAHGMGYNMLTATGALPSYDKAMFDAGQIDTATLRFRLGAVEDVQAQVVNSWDGFQTALYTAMSVPARPTYIIAQNNEFDLILLRKRWDLYPGPPYNFRRTIDIRTLQVFGFLPEKLPHKNHTALQDARAEAEAVADLIINGTLEIKGYITGGN